MSGSLRKKLLCCTTNKDYLVFLLHIIYVFASSVCGVVNQVYTVRILEWWFSVLVTCWSHPRSLNKQSNGQTKGAGWVSPSKDWFDWFGVWPGSRVSWFSRAAKVESLCSRDSDWINSFWAHSVFFRISS